MSLEIQLQGRSKVMASLLVLGLLTITDAWASGPWRAANQNTTGWQYMTPNERVEHQRHMRSFATYEECKAYQAEHHALIAVRALKQGIALKPRPDSGCRQLRQRGKFK